MKTITYTDPEPSRITGYDVGNVPIYNNYDRSYSHQIPDEAVNISTPNEWGFSYQMPNDKGLYTYWGPSNTVGYKDAGKLEAERRAVNLDYSNLATPILIGGVLIIGLIMFSAKRK